MLGPAHHVAAGRVTLADVVGAEAVRAVLVEQVVDVVHKDQPVPIVDPALLGRVQNRRVQLHVVLVILVGGPGVRHERAHEEDAADGSW